MLGHPKGLCWLLCFFYVVVPWFFLTVDVFWLGNFGTTLRRTFIACLVWMRGGFFVASLFLVSFRGRYCECLSCLSTIYLLWVLDTFASPTSPSTSSSNLSSAHPTHTYTKNNIYIYIYYDHDNSSYPSSSTPKGWPQVSRRPGRTVGLGPAGGIDFGCLNFGMMQPKLLIIFFPTGNASQTLPHCLAGTACQQVP